MTPRHAFHIHRHDTIDSTSSEAVRRVRSGTARHGEVHVAREQTQGRGRQGRRWWSAPDEGLYASVVWFADPTPSGAAVTMAAGLAVRTALVELGIEHVRLDWPNDCEVSGHKLAGVLVESLPQPSGAALVVGVGIDVAQRSFPAELLRERPVTSLAILGSSASIDQVLGALLDALAPELARATSGALAELCGDFARATGLLELEVCARVAGREGDRTLVGTLVGITFERGVELATRNGVSAHQLEHVRSLRAVR